MWFFIAYSDERWLYHPFSLPHLYSWLGEWPSEQANIMWQSSLGLGSKRVKVLLCSCRYRWMCWGSGRVRQSCLVLRQRRLVWMQVQVGVQWGWPHMFRWIKIPLAHSSSHSPSIHPIRSASPPPPPPSHIVLFPFSLPTSFLPLRQLQNAGPILKGCYFFFSFLFCLPPAAQFFPAAFAFPAFAALLT